MNQLQKNGYVLAIVFCLLKEYYTLEYNFVILPLLNKTSSYHSKSTSGEKSQIQTSNAAHIGHLKETQTRKWNLTKEVSTFSKESLSFRTFSLIVQLNKKQIKDVFKQKHFIKKKLKSHSFSHHSQERSLQVTFIHKNSHFNHLNIHSWVIIIYLHILTQFKTFSLF